MRNQKAHGGLVSQAEAGVQLRELEKHLRTVIEIFRDIWTEYELISSLEGTYHSHSSLHKLRIQRVMGDRPEFTKQNRTFDHPLDNAFLYLSDPDQQQALKLLPFIKVIQLPKIESNACYFYSRQESTGHIRFVSYHFKPESEITREFQDTAAVLKNFLQ